MSYRGACRYKRDSFSLSVFSLS